MGWMSVFQRSVECGDLRARSAKFRRDCVSARSSGNRPSLMVLARRVRHEMRRVQKSFAPCCAPMRRCRGASANRPRSAICPIPAVAGPAFDEPTYAHYVRQPRQTKEARQRRAAPIPSTVLPPLRAAPRSAGPRGLGRAGGIEGGAIFRGREPSSPSRSTISSSRFGP
jgi:hypothetical protein